MGDSFFSEGKDRKILTDQIRSVDRKRLRDYKGQVSYEILTKFEKALVYNLTQIPTKTLRKELARQS